MQSKLNSVQKYLNKKKQVFLGLAFNDERKEENLSYVKKY